MWGYDLFILKPFSLLILYSALVSDLILGDGNWAFHPIRLMGAAISFAEKRVRALCISDFMAGLIMTAGLVLLTFFLVAIGAAYLRYISEILYFVFSAACIYFGVCLRCLLKEAQKVYDALLAGDLGLARRNLSMLVSRQTESMDQIQISMALIETVSENFVDGILSPFFYAVIGGPALCLSFKMVSTLDSMIGYKTSDYVQFGKAAARLDDMANFVPARISLFVILIAGALTGRGKVVSRIRKILQDARNHKSPNSGFPEAAFAHVLGVRLGGPVMYHGRVTKSPFINPYAKDPGPGDIDSAIKLLYVSSLVSYVLPLLLLLVF